MIDLCAVFLLVLFFYLRMSKPQLKPTKLIPALVRYSQRRMASLSRSTSLSARGSKQPGRDSIGLSVDPSVAAPQGGEGEDLAIKYLEFCVDELKLKARVL